MAKEDRSGSTPRTDPEAFTYSDPAGAGLTAGQLRAAGYDVPAHVGDDEIPGSYAADTRRTDAEPFLVEDRGASHLLLQDKTAAEWAAEQEAGEGSPILVTTLGTTPAQQAVKDSKGSEAEKIGPRAPGKVLDVTPSQAAGTPEPEV